MSGRRVGFRSVGHNLRVSIESEHRHLVALAQDAGEQEVRRFAASHGPSFGFNGVYSYLVTGQSLWRARSGLRTLVGGEESVMRWSLGDCAANLKGDRGIVLTTVEGSWTITLQSGAEARAVATALTPRLSGH